MKIQLPNDILNLNARLFPDIWKKLDAFRYRERENGSLWNPEVFLPIDLWYKFFTENYHNKELIQSALPAMLNLAAWRPTQDVIVYDGDMYGELIKTSLTGRLPGMLAHLPAWSLYFVAPGLQLVGKSFDGFFATTQVSDDREQYFLCLSFVNRDFYHYPVTLPLGDWSLEEAIARRNGQAARQFQEWSEAMGDEYVLHSEAGLHQALNLIIYLFSQGYNASPAEMGSLSFSSALAKKVKGIPRLFPPAKPRVRLLGTEFGEVFRRFRNVPAKSGDRALPCPHIRRAHWHTFRYGSMKEKNRPCRIKWLPPIPVALGNAPEELADAADHLAPQPA